MSPKTTSFISYLTLAISIVVLVIVFQTQGQLDRFGADAAGGLGNFEKACKKLGGTLTYGHTTGPQSTNEVYCEFGDGTIIRSDKDGVINPNPL